MANKGYVATLLNRLPADQKSALVAAFEYVLDNLRLGGAEDMDRAENFAWYRFDSTTASTANDEFSIKHGLNESPTKVLQMLDVTSSGGQVVRLKCSRAADAQRIYLSSPDTGAAISILAEV